MSRSNFQKFIAILGVIFIATTFIGLGVWQWNRAQENRKPVVVDKRLVSLESVAQPRTSLTSKSLLRHVTVTGKYVATFKAPNQSDIHGQISTWEVGLLETPTKSAILVVRGLWAERNSSSENLQSRVIVDGVLLPHQSDDRVEPGNGLLQRLDSSVIVDQTSSDLYDGYVVAGAETIGKIKVDRTWIAPPPPQSAVPGFYWQHISYVIIWWFMSGVVLYLPFYQRHQSRIKPDVEPKPQERIEI